MTRVLLTGATGTVGREVLSQLLPTGARIRVFTRNPNALLPPDIEVATGDLTVPDSLESALEGIDAVFLLWTAPAAAVDSALRLITSRVPRIVYLSAPLRTPHPFFQQPNPMRTMAEQIEHLIETSACGWTLLRPGIFAANALRWWASQIKAGNVLRWPWLSVCTAPIHERDIAAVAIRALLDDKHNASDYVLTGPESLTQREQIHAIGNALGRPLTVEEISPRDAQTELLSVIPSPPVVNMLLDAWAAAEGLPPFVTSCVSDITGQPARTFHEWAIENATGFLR